MPEFAEHITLDLKRKKLLVNGTEFPWFISEDGIDVFDLGSEDHLPSVVVTIPAAHIEVIPAETGTD